LTHDVDDLALTGCWVVTMTELVSPEAVVVEECAHVLPGLEALDWAFLASLEACIVNDAPSSVVLVSV
jgi:hypothetical protein